MEKYCGKCGHELDEKTRLCPQCDKETINHKKKSKKKLKAIIAILCSVSIIFVGVFGTLNFFSDESEESYPNSNYNSFMEGFTDVSVTDEESAIEAVSSVAGALGIVDAQNELEVTSVNTIDGDSFYRMQQYYNDIPVYGSNVVISADENGNATALTSNTINLQGAEFETGISEEEAINVVKDSFDEEVTTSEASLVIFNKSEETSECCIAYSINVVDSQGVNNYFVSAVDGEILYIKPCVYYERVEAKGEDLNGVNRIFYSEKINENLYYLEDSRRSIHTYDAHNSDIFDKNNTWLPEGNEIKSSDNRWTNKKAVALYTRLNDVYDYYKINFDMEGFNNKNGFVYAIINDYFTTNKNARSISAVGTDETIITVTPNNKINLDTVAHEYTHSVIGYNLNLSLGEAGAINEGYADIMGEIIEEDTSWTHGSRTISSPTDNSFPEYYKGENWGDTYDKSEGNDRGNIHQNSTVISHAAYLMWNGNDGKTATIDFVNLGKLWYRSMQFLQSGSDFAQCRNAVELAARTMIKNSNKKEYQKDGVLTPEQYKTVITAFENVGISNAAFTYKDTVSNKFELSVLSSEKTENVYFNLKIVKMPEIIMGPGIVNDEMPEVLMEETQISGQKTLELEDGTYIFLLTDVADTRNISKTISVKIVVDGDNKKAKDKIVINTDFTDIDSIDTEKENEKDENLGGVLSPELAVDIYMANQNVWAQTPEYRPMQGYAYCLIDLDFDGVLELIKSRNDGSGRFSYNNYYRINTDTKTVEEIVAEGTGYESDIDYYYLSHQIQLLKKKTDNSLLYIVGDYIRVSVSDGSIIYFENYMKDGEIYKIPIFEEHTWADYENNLEQITEYVYDGEKVSQSEYEQKKEDYYAQHTDLNLVWKCVYGDDFEEADEDTRRQLLLDAYKSFSYDGFSFDDIQTIDINDTDKNKEKAVNIPADALYYNGHYYKIFSDVCSSWEDAKEYCENLGGHLAVISSKKENDALYQYLVDSNLETAYFGFTDVANEGDWEWVTGEMNQFLNWGTDEPNNEGEEDYAELYWKYKDGAWNDGNYDNGTESDSRNFICEWD